MKERIAGARGQSADGNYRRQYGLGQSMGGIFKRGEDKTLPKNGGWRRMVPVFGGFELTLSGFSKKKAVLSLVWGLHVVLVFEIKSLTRVLD
jgi:hypothetical protein